MDVHRSRGLCAEDGSTRIRFGDPERVDGLTLGRGERPGAEQHDARGRRRAEQVGQTVADGGGEGHPDWHPAG